VTADIHIACKKGIDSNNEVCCRQHISVQGISLQKPKCQVSSNSQTNKTSENPIIYIRILHEKSQVAAPYHMQARCRHLFRIKQWPIAVSVDMNIWIDDQPTRKCWLSWKDSLRVHTISTKQFHWIRCKSDRKGC